MGGGSKQEDNSDEVARIEAASATEARNAQDAKDAQALADFNARLQSGYDTGIAAATQYFSSMGLDPAEYVDEITAMANTTRGSVPQGDTSPGSYFANLGQSVYDAETEALRNRSQNTISSIAPTGFSTARIADTADDATIQAILDEQYNTATEYINNLRDRGVVTGSGYSAAEKNLQNQKPGATSVVNEAGQGILNAGRTGAENLANTARERAGSVKLGESYDPYTLSTDLGNFFTEFFNSLGTKLKTAAGTNLFDTSGLANVAGAAQGAQNIPFNPEAVAGFPDDDEDDTKTTTSTSPF